MGRALVPRQGPDAMRLTQLKSDCLVHMAALGRAKGTLESYDTTFSQFIAYVTTVLRLTDDTAHFTQEHVVGFMAHLHQHGVSPNTIRARLASLGAFAWYGAIRKDHRGRPVVPVNPLVGLERPKGRKPPEKYLLPEELRAFLTVPRPERVSILRDVLVDTGLRVSELCQANVGDLRKVGASTALAVTVKGGHAVEVPLSPPVAESVQEWLASREQAPGELLPEEPLFIDQHGQRYLRTGLAAMVLRIGEAARITRFPVTPHVLRHTLELIRRRAKIDPTVRSRLLTHTNFGSLTSYQHVLPDELAQAREQQVSEVQRYLELVSPEQTGQVPTEPPKESAEWTSQEGTMRREPLAASPEEMEGGQDRRTSGEKAMTEPIELYRQEGETARTIRVYIDNGHLVLGSQDFPSEAVRGFVGGATDYSYDTTVQAAEKDRLLVALIAEKYQGDGGAVEAFRNWCAARSIPCSFETWGSGYFD